MIVANRMGLCSTVRIARKDICTGCAFVDDADVKLPQDSQCLCASGRFEGQQERDRERENIATVLVLLDCRNRVNRAHMRWS